MADLRPADGRPAIGIKLCYAKPDRQFFLELSVPVGATIKQAIEASGLVQHAPEIDVSVWRVGIYGKLKTLDTELRECDRIEIYRPLRADPKDSRRRRAIAKSDRSANPDESAD